MKQEDAAVRLDRMRYTKNTLSSTLVLIAIIFNVFYFVSVYRTDVGTYYYKIIIGASVVYNLVFMLIAFLSSEGLKNYNPRFAYTVIVIGLLQIARIFYLPWKAHHATVTLSEVETRVMSDAQFTRIVIYLSLSAACCLAAGIIGAVKSRKLAAYTASLGEV